jgi:hypothetical protein
MKALYSLFLIVIFVQSHASERHQEVDLWLPKTYQNHFVLLTKAADLVKQDKYCHKLLTGRLMESQSRLDHPVFHFRCRAKNKRSFSVQVDGLTMGLTNEYGEKQRAIEEAKRKEEERLQAIKNAEIERLDKEELEALRQKQSHYWKICRTAMKKRLQRFDKVEIVSAIPPIPNVDGYLFSYSVDFDAQSQSRLPIYFTINCDIQDLEDYTVSVKSRR